MLRGALGSIISEVVLRTLDETRDGRDVHDASGPSGVVLCRFMQQRQKGRSSEEYRGHICAVDIEPFVKCGLAGVE